MGKDSFRQLTYFLPLARPLSEDRDLGLLGSELQGCPAAGLQGCTPEIHATVARLSRPKNFSAPEYIKRAFAVAPSPPTRVVGARSRARARSMCRVYARAFDSLARNTLPAWVLGRVGGGIVRPANQPTRQKFSAQRKRRPQGRTGHKRSRVRLDIQRSTNGCSSLESVWRLWN